MTVTLAERSDSKRARRELPSLQLCATFRTHVGRNRGHRSFSERDHSELTHKDDRDSRGGRPGIIAADGRLRRQFDVD